MRKHRVLVILSVVVGIAIVIGCADLTMNRIFYSPYRDFEANSTTFMLTAEAVVPSASLAYVSPLQPGTPRHFSRYSQKYFINESSQTRDINSNPLSEGDLEYLFGKITPAYDVAPAKPMAYTQGYFEQPAAMDSGALAADSYYMAFLAFPKPLSFEEMWEIAQACFDTPSYPDCIRVMVKTSEREDDIALGVGGDGAFFSLSQGGYATLTPHRMGLFFVHNLTYLSYHQSHADVFLGSGLFGEKASIDFSQRLEYVREHGEQCIGMVAFAQGSDIQQLTQDSRCVLVDAYPD